MSLRRSLHIVLGALLVASLLACGASRENLNVDNDALMGGAKAGDFGLKVAEGDAHWAQRDNRDELKAAIASWEEAVTLESTGLDADARRLAVYDVYVKISHAYYFLTDAHIRFDAEDPDDVAEPMMATYDKGVIAAEKALYLYSPAYQDAVVNKGVDREKAVEQGLLDKGAIPAMYWYATNLGKWSLLVGLAETLGHVDTIKAMIGFIETNDAGFFYHAPLRYFGAYYTKLPFPGGDLEKSKVYFDRAIAGSPTYLGTRVLYAEMYAVKADDEALYKENLQYVLDAAADADPDLIPENKAEKEKARRLLDELDDNF